MNTQFAFNPQGVPQREDRFTPMPAGWYLLQIVESAIVNLESGNGQGLKLTAAVIQQQYQGRKVFIRMNVRHKNPQAERIAQQELRELCEAVGLAQGFTDTVQLHGRPFLARLTVRPERVKNPQRPQDGKYDAENEVKGYKPANAQVNTAPVAAASGAAPPWAGGQQQGQGAQQQSQPQQEQQAPAQTQAQTAAAPAKNAPPWQR